MKIRLLLPLMLLGLLVACQQAAKEPAYHAIDVKNMDTTVKPCDDFYAYANGNYLKNTKIPAENASWGAFNEVYESSLKQLHTLLDDAAAKVKEAPAGSNAYKVGHLYAQGMDSATIEQQGVTSLKPILDRIGEIKDAKGLASYLAYTHSMGNSPAFSFDVTQDPKNTVNQIPELDQGGLGLPDRDYYTRSDAKSKSQAAAYKVHVQHMFQLLGDDSVQAKKEAATVFEFETRLAKASLARVDRRDPDKLYHKVELLGIAKFAPAFDWKSYFTELGVPASTNELNIETPAFFEQFNKEVSHTPIADWKTYLRWQAAHNAAPFLSSAFVQENFNFYSATLNGVKQLRPRWKRVLRLVDGQLGEALGQVYVEKYFPPASKTRMLELVANLRAALKDRLATLEWMSDSTRQLALKKLDAFAVKIGYPDKWRDYSALALDGKTYLDNVMQGDAFEMKRQLAKIGKPVDRTEWGMTPPTVNAYYNPLMNEIVFPAGILQPPFFDPQADDAVNYGSIGVVIGHEITHGFDDEGRKFDAQGNLKNWWTKTDEKNFTARGENLARQYNKFVAVDTLHVNGHLTLGENIADLGGLKIAYLALQKSLQGKPKPEKIDGFTPEQRFFLGFATVWREINRPEAIRSQVLQDPHSPGRYRTLGPVANLPEFYSAFGCKSGNSLYKQDSSLAKIW